MEVSVSVVNFETFSFERVFKQENSVEAGAPPPLDFGCFHGFFLSDSGFSPTLTDSLASSLDHETFPTPNLQNHLRVG